MYHSVDRVGGRPGLARHLHLERGDAALLNPREFTVDVKLIKQSPALPEIGTALGSSRGRHSREDSGSRSMLFTQPGWSAW